MVGRTNGRAVRCVDVSPRQRFWLRLAILAACCAMMSSCRGVESSTLPEQRPSLIQASAQGPFMAKWAAFRVPAGQSIEAVLARVEFSGPILLRALEIHARPSPNVPSAAKIYVMKTDTPISEAGADVLAVSGTWSLSDPFRAQMFRFPKPIRVDSGNMIVRAQIYNFSNTQDTFESGELIIYFEPE